MSANPPPQQPFPPGPPPIPQQFPPPQQPYGAPQPLNYNSAPQFSGQPCPRCRQYAAMPVSFTWWGGVLGPKLLNHHKCRACGYTFNGRTGQPNDTAIAIYLVVGLVIAIVLGIVFFVLARRF